MADNDINTIKLGTAVTYVGRKGDHKMALVIGTHETITPDTSIPVPQPGHLHLMVFSPTGNHYPVHSIPYIELVQDMEDFKDEAGNVASVWRFSA